MADPAATMRAIELYKRGPADFADYLIGEMNQLAGCKATLTFDEDAARHSTFALLKL